MLKSLFIKATTSALLLGSLSVSADVTIDLFSDTQAILSVTGGGSAASSVLGGDIIGGERDIEVIAGTGVIASAEVFNDQLLIASSGGRGGSEVFSVEVQWDGIDGSSAVDTDGLFPSADFSQLNGFSAEVNNSDGSGSFDVTLWDTFGETAVLNLNFLPVGAPFGPPGPITFSIPFTLFTGINASLDLSSIGAIVLKLASEGDTDIRVAAIRAVPTPSTLAVLGLGLLGFAGFARRKA